MSNDNKRHWTRDENDAKARKGLQELMGEHARPKPPKSGQQIQPKDAPAKPFAKDFEDLPPVVRRALECAWHDTYAESEDRGWEASAFDWDEADLQAHANKRALDMAARHMPDGERVFSDEAVQTFKDTYIAEIRACVGLDE